MTNLNLQQGSNVEVINNAILNKLYEIATSNSIQSCNLEGNLLTPHCLKSVYNYFTGNVSEDVKRFPDLSINVTAGMYIDFADPVIADYWINSEYGDGEGITEASAASVTAFYNSNPSLGIAPFKDNTDVTSFDELKYFTNLTAIPPRCFSFASNLTTIDLSNIVEIYNSAFLSTGLQGVINLPKLLRLGTASGHGSPNYGYGWAFANCTGITEINIGSQVDDANKITSLHGNEFRGCSNLQKITGLNKLTKITGYDYADCTSLTSVDINFQNITEIGESAFANDPFTTGVLNLTNITSLSNASFRNTYYSEINIGSSFALNNNQIISSLFNSCTNLETITGLGNKITKLGDGFFTDCTSLLSVDLNLSTVTKVGKLVFRRTSFITDVQLPSLTGTLGEYAFENTSILQVSNLGSCTVLDIFCFLNCNQLTSVTLPNTLTTIKAGAFLNDSNLLTINIPSSITQIDGSAFRNCSSLTGPLDLSNITSMGGQHTFRDCSSLIISAFPKTVEYKESFFRNIANTSITIPKEVQLITNGALSFCTNLTSVTFETGSQLTKLLGSCFYSCTSLTSIKLPEGLTSMLGKEFAGCTSLTSVDLPSTLTSMGDECFYTTALSSLTVRATTPPTVTSNMWKNGMPSSCNIYVPSGSVNAYKAATGWSNMANQIKGISELPQS